MHADDLVRALVNAASLVMEMEEARGEDDLWSRQASRSRRISVLISNFSVAASTKYNQRASPDR